MKVFSIFTAALLCLAANATPVPEEGTAFRNGFLAAKLSQRVTDAKAILARDAAAEKVGLIKRAELNCEIVNVVTVVDCHYWPTHASTWQGADNYVVTSFAGGTKHDFDCYLDGQTVGGIE